MAGLFAGCALGLMVAATGGGAGLLLAITTAKRRHRVWWCFAGVFVVALSTGIVAVHQYPYDHVRPGSDYDVALKNLFLQGLGYCATPGPAALLAGLATLFMPRRIAARCTEKDRIG